MTSPLYRRIHLYAFRTVIVSTLLQPAMFFIDLDGGPGHWRLHNIDVFVRLAQCIAVFGHHFYSAFSAKSLPSVFDSTLVLAELAASLTLVGWTPSSYTFNRWDNSSYTTFLVSIYAQAVALVILSIFRIYRMVVLYRKLGGKSLSARFNFSSALGQHEHMPWRFYVFGTSVFASRYLKEPFLIKGFRALLAYAIIGGIIILAFFALVLGPVQEEALSPVKTYRSPLLVLNNFRSLEPPVWRIFAIVYHNRDVEPEDFESAINVTALWDDDGPTPACTFEKSGPPYIQGSEGRYIDLLAQVGTFLCPSRTPSDDILPDIEIGRSLNNVDPSGFLITVNFTSLNMTSDSLVNAERGAVSFLVGLTGDDDQVIRNTVPTMIFPGSHLLGGISCYIRQIDTSPSLASLGIPTFSRAFFIADLISLASDPSTLINQLPNIGTLRIYRFHKISDWTVVQDYREKSVLDGFTQVGGFWVFTNGLFAFFFGSTLTMIVLGAKPLSIFGAFDNVGRRKLRNHFHKEYPLLEKEAFSEQRGLLTFLHEHIVDLDILKPEGPADVYKDTGDAGHGLPHVTGMEQSMLLPASRSAQRL